VHRKVVHDLKGQVASSKRKSALLERHVAALQSLVAELESGLSEREREHDHNREKRREQKQKQAQTTGSHHQQEALLASTTSSADHGQLSSPLVKKPVTLPPTQADSVPPLISTATTTTTSSLPSSVHQINPGHDMVAKKIPTDASDISTLTSTSVSTSTSIENDREPTNLVADFSILEQLQSERNSRIAVENQLSTVRQLLVRIQQQYK
jgi:hypothetical protein